MWQSDRLSFRQTCSQTLGQANQDSWMELKVTHSSDSFVTLWIVTCQAPLSMEFSRQEYWSGLPFPSSGDVPNPGMDPASPAPPGRFFTTEVMGSPAGSVMLHHLLATRQPRKTNKQTKRNNTNFCFLPSWSSNLNNPEQELWYLWKQLDFSTLPH